MLFLQLPFFFLAIRRRLNAFTPPTLGFLSVDFFPPDGARLQLSLVGVELLLAILNQPERRHEFNWDSLSFLCALRVFLASFQSEI